MQSATAQPPESLITPAEAVAVGCPLTVPDPSFEPPPPTAAKPPAYYHSGWYGSAHLWTLIEEHGEVWQSLPHGPGGLGQKTFWWSADWHVDRELEPAITVSGRRLDGAGSFVVDPPGTNAEADFGVAMLAGVDIPSRGCWEITGSYRAASLSIVVWVEDN